MRLFHGLVMGYRQYKLRPLIAMLWAYILPEMAGSAWLGSCFSAINLLVFLVFVWTRVVFNARSNDKMH